jgi:putative ABC transport system permease protein
MRRSLRSWLWSVPLDQEVDDEIAFHLEMRTRELIAQGLDPATARERATARVGDLARLRHDCVAIARKRDREMRFTLRLQEFRDDVRFAFRQLRRAPGFTAIATMTLALGIGANSAIFALVDATLLRPVPFAHPDRLVAVWERFNQFSRAVVAPLNFDDWEARNRSFEVMAAFFGFPRRMTARDGTAEQLPGQQVTPRFFDVLGVTPIVGRTFRPSDEALPPNVVVISEDLWRSRFAADPAVVGTVIRLDGQPFTVLGVVPDTSQLRGPTSVWTVWSVLPGIDPRGMHFMQVIGRLKAGVTIDAARSDMTAIADALARELPATNKGRGVTLEPLGVSIVGNEIRLTSMLFLGVVGLVLLMCCANLASLLLARLSGRARELAVRSALGAGRRRIMSQVLTESLVLSALGGALGLALGAGILEALPYLIPSDLIPSTIALTFDRRVIMFGVATSLSTAVLFGVAPAWQATGLSVLRGLASDSRSVTQGPGRLRNALVVGEVAVAVLLLCGAGLLLRTLAALDDVDPGYRANNVLTMQVALEYGLPSSHFPNEESMRRFFDTVEGEVRQLPGVRNVGWGGALPLDRPFGGTMSFEIAGDAPRDQSSRPLSDYMIVSPSYLQTLDIPIVAGRGFTEQDTAASPPICIVNEAFVRKHLAGRNVLGTRVRIRQMSLRRDAPTEREIVGVVRQVKGRPDEAEPPVQVYVPLSQNAWSSASLVVRSTGAPAESLAGAVRAAVARVDRDVPLTRVRTLDEVASEATARPRFRAGLVLTFAGLALILAMIGVFGVLAYTVQQRTREFGVRIALGASVSDVLRLVAASAARTTAIGAVIGLIAAGLVSRTIRTLLFGVAPVDPLTFAAAASVLLVTAAVATASPALRAARTNPLVTFRNE